MVATAPPAGRAELQALPPDFKFGPYYNVQSATRLVFGKKHSYVVGIAGGYNANGLIGTEHNGIFVLDDTLKRVVVDEICCDSGCFQEVTRDQQTTYNWLCQTGWSEFRDFINAQDNLRYKLENTTTKPRKPSKRSAISQFIRIATRNMAIHAYDDENAAIKQQFLELGKRVMGYLAEMLDLEKADRDISVNAGGVACSGDIYLHSDTVFVNFCQSALGPGYGFMYRKPKNRKDSCGGANHWMQYEQLRDMATAAIQIKRGLARNA
jgi:hypothetical protein